MTKVFIDGSAGTTGLRIRERLAGRKDLEVLTLSEELRKDADARREMLKAADSGASRWTQRFGITHFA